MRKWQAGGCQNQQQFSVNRCWKPFGMPHNFVVLVFFCSVCYLSSLIMVGDKWITSGNCNYIFFTKSRLRSLRPNARIGPPLHRNVQTTRRSPSQPYHPKRNCQTHGKHLQSNLNIKHLKIISISSPHQGLKICHQRNQGWNKRLLNRNSSSDQDNSSQAAATLISSPPSRVDSSKGERGLAVKLLGRFYEENNPGTPS